MQLPCVRYGLKLGGLALRRIIGSPQGFRFRLSQSGKVRTPQGLLQDVPGTQQTVYQASAKPLAVLQPPRALQEAQHKQKLGRQHKL